MQEFVSHQYLSCYNLYFSENAFTSQAKTPAVPIKQQKETYLDKICSEGNTAGYTTQRPDEYA